MKPFILKGLILTCAAFIQGFAMAIFLFPHFIPSGGAASISVLFEYLWNVPHGISLWIVNVTMLMVALKWLGKSTAFWTIYCVTISSMTIHIFSFVMSTPFSVLIIDLVLGSLVFGAGVGVLFRMGASSGGMDILALIISKLHKVTPGKSLFWINGFLLTGTALIVDWRIILYAIACQWISTRVIDTIYKVKIRGVDQVYQEA